MEIQSERVNNGTLLRVTGDVDLSSSPVLRTKLSQLTKKRAGNILLDLRGVPFMDSSGLATLIECLKTVRQYGGALKLIGVGARVREVFSLAQLDSIFSFYMSVEDATK